MSEEKFDWLKIRHDGKLESSSVFTGRLIEIALLGVLIPLFCFGFVSLVQLVKALSHVTDQPIAGPLFYVVFVFLILMFGLTRKEFAESAQLVYGVFETVIQLISGFIIGTIEVLGGPPALTRAVGFQLLMSVITLGGVIFSYVYLSQNIFSLLLSWPGRDWQNILHWVGETYVLATLCCFAVFTIQIATSEKWWQVFSRVRVQTNVEPVSVEAGESPETKLILAHVSDLHAHAKGHHLIENPERSVPPAALENIFANVRDTAGIDAIVVSGDATDDGSAEAWTALLSTSSWQAVQSKVILAPGNHDLNYLESSHVKSCFRIERRTKPGMHMRALRYLRVADFVMGDRASLVSPFTGGMTTLREVMQRVKGDFEDWEAGTKLTKNSSLPLEILEKCFPMAVHTEGTQGKCVFFVWNTVKPNSLPVWNSVGEISSEQIERARALLKHTPPSMPIVHVLHHQISLPRAKTYRAILKRAFGVGMVLNYSQRFFDWLAELRQSTVLLHGHHHKAFWCVNTNSKVTIVSTPSGTLGCEESFFTDVKSETHVPYWLRLTIGLRGANAHVGNVAPISVVAESKELRLEDTLSA